MPSGKDLALMEIFSRISEENLSPNEFYVMCCMKESISPINVNLHQTLKTLQDNHWISHDMQLLPKAHSLISTIDSFFKVQKKKTSSQLLGKDFVENMTKYNELFPRKKAGSGKYMRASLKNIETAFRWFFENHDYDWDTILEATARYLSQEMLSNYKFTRTSMYFIRKSDKGLTSSDLADWCEIVKSGEEADEKQSFTEKVV